ncbi:MAG: metal-dependent hydrolase [Gammaproteobacteria bacterium]|nr:metal-dependent hydrolase [Gammaproteobacteria bacterium]
MNGPTHQFAGAIAALVMTQNDTPEKSCALHHPAAAIPVGAFLGRLPDMIEPALGNPNHRQFFHSVVVLGLLAAGMRKVYHWEPQDEVEKIIRGVLLVGGAAYLSHLALDALTSRSLPFVGRV